MVKVVSLDSKRKEVNEVNHDALELLESVLPRIKSGEITAIGISWVEKDGSIGGKSSEGSDNIKMWASLEHNAREFYSAMLDDN